MSTDENIANTMLKQGLPAALIAQVLESASPEVEKLPAEQKANYGKDTVQSAHNKDQDKQKSVAVAGAEKNQSLQLQM